MNYQEFISKKHRRTIPSGFAWGESLEWLFPFQNHVVDWALRLGKAALFLNTGMGKTRCQIAWSDAVATRTGGCVIIVAPLAVSMQTIREAERCGIKIVRVNEQSEIGDAQIVITNYERLGKFDMTSFVGVVLDESSILKSVDGKTKKAILSGFKSTPYRLTCTATPAPNDHKELGNHAEFLGAMSSVEMLSRWFLNDAADTGEWRLKGHAVDDFWRWVSSWAKMAEFPSDLGDFSDDGYVLPPLRQHSHLVASDVARTRDDATLFRIPDMSLTGLHGELRRSAPARASKVAEIVASEPDEQWLIWCDTDYEADELMERIPGAIEIRGSHSQEKKESALIDFADGNIRTLITKPKIAGFGMNFQQCARVAFVGATYSFESRYQSIRRSWRFGQTREVHVHSVMATSEETIWKALNTKQEEFESMKANMLKAERAAVNNVVALAAYDGKQKMNIPSWLVEVAQ